MAMNRVKWPDTWLHRPILQNVKKVLANPEPSTHDPNETLDAWKEGCSTLPGRAGTSNAFSAAYGSRTVSVDLEQT